jgi:hypothetical protein
LTSKTKSLLPSLYKREDFPLFGKGGLGEIFTICLFNHGLLGNRLMALGLEIIALGGASERMETIGKRI